MEARAREGEQDNDGDLESLRIEKMSRSKA